MVASSFAVLARSSRTALCAGIVLTLTATASVADSRCQQLEELNRQYIGVSLTTAQQALKRKMVAWYKANCRQRRASAS